MKRIFGFLFASCLSLVATAQQYNMSTTSVSTCSGTFFDSGGPSSNYSNNQNHTMTFTSSNGNRLVMTFISFNVEIYDQLYIYDGPSTSSQLIGNYFSNPGTITSTGTSLTFVFTSDNSQNYSGWSASINCGGPPLTVYNMSSGTFTGCEGLFYDNGGWNTNYADNQDVTQTFCSGTSDHLQFTFANASISLGSGDTLFAYDGATTAASPLAVYVAGSNCEGFTSSGTCITFRFKSDASNNSSGWDAEFNCTSAGPTTGYYSMSSGTRYVCDAYFYDSGATGNYSNNENRTMTFTSYNGNRLVFSFTSFYVEIYDQLKIYDGPNTSYQLIGSYFSNPGTITSTGSSLTFVFTSDNSQTYSGWAASINCGGPVIPFFPLSSGTVTVCEGLFFDSGGMFGNYQNNEDREMTFTSASGEYLQFDFDPDYMNIDVNDSLFIYDGASTSAPLYAILTNTDDWPGIIVSSTNSFTFRFKSDGVNHHTGWQAWITCVSAPNYTPHMDMTSGVRYVCGGYFFDPGGAGDYASNEDRLQTFYSNSGCALGITFTMFDTEPLWDMLYVYDGPTIASPLIGQFSGGGIPPTVQSTGNSLTFRFVSNATASFYSGWSAYFFCVNQPTATVSGGPTTICNGDTVVLNASPNTSYLWNTGATTQSIPVTSPGSYWVTVQNASNCSAISPMTIVNTGTPTAVVTAGGPTSFCQGDSVTLTASGGGSYLWSDNSTGSTLNVTQSGTYYVIADNGSCSDTSANITVNVNPLPAVALTLPLDTFCTMPPQIFTLTGGSPAGGVYSGPGVSGGQLDPVNAGTGTHTMTYTYTDANGCLNTATQSFVVDVCNGISTPSANGALSVSPNPTDDLLLITFAGGNAVNQIQLMDVTGRVVLEQSTNGQAQVTVSMKTLPAGVYLLRTVGGTNETVRVVKE